MGRREEGQESKVTLSIPTHKEEVGNSGIVSGFLPWWGDLKEEQDEVFSFSLGLAPELGVEALPGDLD